MTEPKKNTRIPEIRLNQSIEIQHESKIADRYDSSIEEKPIIDKIAVEKQLCCDSVEQLSDDNIVHSITSDITSPVQMPIPPPVQMPIPPPVQMPIPPPVQMPTNHEPSAFSSDPNYKSMYPQIHSWNESVIHENIPDKRTDNLNYDTYIHNFKSNIDRLRIENSGSGGSGGSGGISPRIDAMLATFNFAALPKNKVAIMRDAINRKDEQEIAHLIEEFNPHSWNITYDETIYHWDEALREKVFMHQELLDILNKKIQRYQTITMVVSIIMSAFVTTSFFDSEPNTSNAPAWYNYTQKGITTGGTLLITFLTSLLKLKGYQERTLDIQRYLDKLKEIHGKIQGIFITPPDFRQDPVEFISRTLPEYINLILTEPKLTNSECSIFKERYNAWKSKKASSVKSCKLIPPQLSHQDKLEKSTLKFLSPLQIGKDIIDLGCCCLPCNRNKQLANKGSKFDSLATSYEYREHYHSAVQQI